MKTSLMSYIELLNLAINVNKIKTQNVVIKIINILSLKVNKKRFLFALYFFEILLSK